MNHWQDDPRTATQPIFNDNRLKLGTFGTNGGGIALTKVEEASEVSWRAAINAGVRADAQGFEAIVPFARWKGYVEEDPVHRTGVAFDCYTWAAAHGQATSHAGIFSTSHVPTIHPLLAAKQCATIDHITAGRFGLNVVAGWNRPELEMFGAPMREHDERYDQADEWLQIVKRLWTEGEAFDFQGRFYTLQKAISLPHPIQQPIPPIMSAGGSERGQHFASKHADMLFIILQSSDVGENRQQIAAIREFARRHYERELQVWSSAYVVQGETQQEAEAFLKYYSIEHGDERAVDGVTRLQGINAQGLPSEVLDSLRNRFKAGMAGYELVGTAEHITARAEAISDAGLDGLLLSWVNYEAGVEAFGAHVLPRLEQAGLRRPYQPQRGTPVAA